MKTIHLYFYLGYDVDHMPCNTCLVNPTCFIDAEKVDRPDGKGQVWKISTWARCKTLHKFTSFSGYYSHRAH